MDRKPWKSWSVSNNTAEMSKLSELTHKRLIHEHRYDSAHVCLCAEKGGDPQLLSCGFMLLRGCLYYNIPGVRLCGGSILTGGHNANPGAV